MGDIAKGSSTLGGSASTIETRDDSTGSTGVALAVVNKRDRLGFDGRRETFFRVGVGAISP